MNLLKKKNWKKKKKHKQKSDWEICFMSWLEWQTWMTSENYIFDRQYSTVSDVKYFIGYGFWPWEMVDLLTLKYQLGELYHLFHVFCRIWGLDILSCLLQNTNSTVIIHFLFLYVLCWNLGLWIASLSHSNLYLLLWPVVFFVLCYKN